MIQSHKPAKVRAVSISSTKGQPKQNVDSGLLVVGQGLAGDAHAGSGHRQISLLALESIEAMRQKGGKVGPGDFAENITTSNINLPALPIGTQLQIGDAVLEVSQIGKKCHQGCAIYEQIGDCVMPKEGIFAIVLLGGPITVGDEIKVMKSD
jgi:MOSC domain-containing protein YiiM